MKALWLSFFLIASVILVSVALPEDKGKDHHSLLDSTPEQETPLQRRRPPVKVPGPKLKKDEETPDSMQQLSDEGKGKKKGKKDVNLTKEDKATMELASPDDDWKKGEKGKKGKEKDKDLVRRDEFYEETQEERNSYTP